MAMEENRSLQPPAGIAGILITEAIAVILLLLALTAMKYFFKGSYEDIKSFYDTALCTDTDIKEVIETAGGDIVEV